MTSFDLSFTEILRKNPEQHFVLLAKCSYIFGQQIAHTSKGGLTRNDLYDTICMTFIRFKKSYHTNSNAERCPFFAIYTFRLVESYKLHHTNHTV